MFYKLKSRLMEEVGITTNNGTRVPYVYEETPQGCTPAFNCACGAQWVTMNHIHMGHCDLFEMYKCAVSAFGEKMLNFSPDELIQFLRRI
jgi:hypothetical protein